VPVLVAAVVLIGLVSLLNLLLCLGVIRRLREQGQAGPHRHGATDPGPIQLPVGQPVPAFEARTVTGEPIGPADLTGRTIVGFFSPGCEACEVQLPLFVTAARESHRPPVAVVVGPDDTTAPYVEKLRDSAQVVQEQERGPIQQAFGVRGFPAFVLVEDGVLGVNDYELSSLPALR
jgi:hypothetical protein